MSVHGRNDKAMKRLKSNTGHKNTGHVISDPIMHSPDRTTKLVIGKKLK